MSVKFISLVSVHGSDALDFGCLSSIVSIVAVVQFVCQFDCAGSLEVVVPQFFFVSRESFALHCDTHQFFGILFFARWSGWYRK